MELKQRIYKARTDKKWTQEQLAEAVGKTRGAVAQWESGEVRPRHSTLVNIARETGKNLLWLLHGNEDNESQIGLNVVGEVAAGRWLEGYVHYEKTIQPVAPHPDYPPSAQRLYKVVGNSINRVAKDGEYLHAVDILATEIRPEDGDMVVVARHQHGMTEYTAKLFINVNGRWVLRPESTDPEWQDDIIIEADDGVDVQITDIVIGKWAPIPRRRTKALY